MISLGLGITALGVAGGKALSISATVFGGSTPAMVEVVASDFSTSPQPSSRSPAYYKWLVVHETETAPAFSRSSNIAWISDKSQFIAYGPRQCFFLPFAGNYTITCTRTVNGVESVATTEVTVAAAPAISAAYRYVDPDSDFSGVPVGAGTHTTLASANSGGLLQDRFIFLRYGKTYPISAFLDVRPQAGFNTYIQAFGNPVDGLPIISQGTGTYIWLRGSGGNVFISDVRFEGGYDAATETSSLAVQREAFRIENGQKVAFNNVEVDGADTAFLALNSGGEAPMLVNDCLVTNWADYGVFTENTRSYVRGSEITQKITALGGGDAADKVHGPWRCADNLPLVVDMVYMFSNTGWTTNIGADGNQHPAHQSCIRVNANGEEGAFVHAARSIFEGGAEVIASYASGGANVSGGNVPGNIVFDGCVLIGTANTRHMVSAGFPGTRFVNSVFVMPNVPPEYFQMESWVIPGQEPVAGSGSSGLDVPIVFENVHLVDLRNAANNTTDAIIDVFDLSAYSARGYAAPIGRNNTAYVPNITIPVDADGPFDATTFYTPTYRGLYHADLGAGAFADPSYATPAATGSLFEPTTGAGAASGGTAPNSPFELDQTSRTNSASRGAFDTLPS